MIKIDLNEKVEKFMRKTLYFVDAETSVFDASLIMKAHGVGSVIVKEKDKPVGIVTERDILNKVVSEGKDPHKVKVKQIMSSPLVVIRADETVEEALKKMLMYGFRRLPVVNEKGEIVGLLAQRFLIRGGEEELIRKAEFPLRLSKDLHDFYRGKIEVISKVPITSMSDFSIWYTPGVASPCKEISKDKEKVFFYTNKWNNVAIVSDGSRTLGLGDIGPYAALPVMEGKALLFRYLGAVDAFPICINEKDPEKIIEIVKAIEPSFGGVNLEDIASPKCFYLLERLQEELEIPIWHDDQQGTAAATLAALINALEIVGKDHRNVVVTLLGSGAANIKVADLLIKYGFKPGNLIMLDSKGILNVNRKDLEDNPYKLRLAKITNSEQREGGLEEAIKNADILIAYSKPGPGVVKKEHILAMNKDPIVIVGANPVPEIWPWEAREAGAKIVATGRSDFPNQINNSLVFPAVFRGTLEVMSKKITDEMCIAAAQAIALTAKEYGINEDYIIPSMEQEEVYINEAVAVALKAQEQGLAKLKLSKSELEFSIKERIERARKLNDLLVANGIIKRKPFTI